MYTYTNDRRRLKQWCFVSSDWNTWTNSSVSYDFVKKTESNLTVIKIDVYVFDINELKGITQLEIKVFVSVITVFEV